MSKSVVSDRDHPAWALENKFSSKLTKYVSQCCASASYSRCNFGGLTDEKRMGTQSEKAKKSWTISEIGSASVEELPQKRQSWDYGYPDWFPFSITTSISQTFLYFGLSYSEFLFQTFKEYVKMIWRSRISKLML